MKKTLVALAALAVTGAFAQSTVTLYGAVDAGVVFSSSEGNSRTSLGNSQLGSSKIGFMGTEDLGGGLKANFKLEGGLANDTGNGKQSNSNNQRSGSGVTGGVANNLGGQQGLVFQRFSYVGLSGGFGELRLGRDYTSTFITMVGADPFGTNGPADATLLFLNLGGGRGQATTANASNLVGYETPKMGGFSAKGQLFFGENSSAAANGTDGDGYSLSGTYANGPIFVSLGQMVTKGTAAAAVAGASLQTFGDYTQQALSATYDLGVAKLAYTYVKEQSVTNAAATATNQTNHIGVTVPMGAMNLKASYGRAVQNTGVAGAGDTAGVLVGLGADYALSKRTKAYVTYANMTNEGGGNSYAAGSAGGLSAKANASSQSLGVGIFHAF